MIEEQAQVIDIDGDMLLLQADTKSACGSCSAQKGCGTAVLSKVVGRKFSRFQAINNIGADVGDTVVVGIAEDALVKGSLMMYTLPLVSMLLFALLADINLAVSYQGRDLMIIGFALAGLISGSILARWYFRRNSSSRLYSPVVLRKIIEHGKL